MISYLTQKSLSEVFVPVAKHQTTKFTDLLDTVSLPITDISIIYPFLNTGVQLKQPQKKQSSSLYRQLRKQSKPLLTIQCFTANSTDKLCVTIWNKKLNKYKISYFNKALLPMEYKVIIKYERSCQFFCVLKILLSKFRKLNLLLFILK